MLNAEEDFKEQIYFCVSLFSHCKGNVNRGQNKMNLFIFYAEVPLASSKGGVFREFPINLWGKSAAWDKIRCYLCDVKK
ncbi:MAG: hypothetical protein HPZ87_12995 [Bacteroides sp.]|nr:hypothetical protein [Bacteroides sp.]RHE33309.1 hypothetical protein DW749_16085 [Bacteroides uniformis]